jgi:hypothetical protein
MRSYSARLTALAIDVPYKWLDNLLSRHTISGVTKARQGIERRITDEGVQRIELCRILNLELGVSLERAVAVAAELMASRVGETLSYATPAGLSLHLSIALIERRLRDRIADAVEAVAQVPRGRPPRSGDRGLE